MRASFPNLRVTVERTVAQDDLVVGHLKMSGTLLGEFMGASASGKTFGIAPVDIMRVPLDVSRKASSRTKRLGNN